MTAPDNSYLDRPYPHADPSTRSADRATRLGERQGTPGTNGGPVANPSVADSQDRPKNSPRARESDETFMTIN